jgi:hypothetical protein
MGFKPNQDQPLVITRQALKEIDELMLGKPIPSDNLSYREAQQLIVLEGLRLWANSYGITLPFGIDLDK